MPLRLQLPLDLPLDLATYVLTQFVRVDAVCRAMRTSRRVARVCRAALARLRTTQLAPDAPLLGLGVVGALECERYDDDARWQRGMLRTLARKCGNLRRVDHPFRQATPKDLQRLLRGCRRIEYLGTWRLAPAGTFSGARVPRLPSLTALGVRGSRRADLSAIARCCPNLEQLRFTACDGDGPPGWGPAAVDACYGRSWPVTVTRFASRFAAQLRQLVLDTPFERDVFVGVLAMLARFVRLETLGVAERMTASDCILLAANAPRALRRLGLPSNLEKGSLRLFDGRLAQLTDLDIAYNEEEHDAWFAAHPARVFPSLERLYVLKPLLPLWRYALRDARPDVRVVDFAKCSLWQWR